MSKRDIGKMAFCWEHEDRRQKLVFFEGSHVTCGKDGIRTSLEWSKVPKQLRDTLIDFYRSEAVTEAKGRNRRNPNWPPVTEEIVLPIRDYLLASLHTANAHVSVAPMHQA